MLKFITILYNNDKEINLLFSSIEKVISEFQLVISLNSKLKDKINDKRVIYVGNELNIGFGKAINRSIKYIDKDDVLCILNSDVIFDKLDVKVPLFVGIFLVTIKSLILIGTPSKEPLDKFFS